MIKLLLALTRLSRRGCRMSTSLVWRSCRRLKKTGSTLRNWCSRTSWKLPKRLVRFWRRRVRTLLRKTGRSNHLVWSKNSSISISRVVKCPKLILCVQLMKLRQNCKNMLRNSKRERISSNMKMKKTKTTHWLNPQRIRRNPRKRNQQTKSNVFSTN